MSPSNSKHPKQEWSSKGPVAQPVIPLVREKPEDPEDDKSKYITMEVKNKVGGKTTYKMFVRIFEEGTPQQWLDLLQDIKLIWTQNSVDKAGDRIASLHGVLRGESKTAFEAALVGVAVDEDDESVEVTNEHIDLALKEVGKEVFPRQALELQRLWMLCHFKKPHDLSIRKTVAAITRMNNLLPLFPEGDEDAKFSETELVDLIEWSLPNRWRAKFDLDNYIPSRDTKAKLVEECEAIERNSVQYDDAENKKKKENKKSKNGKSAGDDAKSGSKKNNRLYCSKCGRNGTHTTDKCWFLKKERDARDTPKREEKKPFSKRTFRKEANAIVRKAANKGSLNFLAKSLERQQGRDKKKVAKKVEKPACSDTDSDSDESIHMVVPRKATPRKPVPHKSRSNYKNASIRHIEDPFADDSAMEKEIAMRNAVANKKKEFALKRKAKMLAATAAEAAFLETTAELERMEVDEKEEESLESMDAE